MKFIRTFDVRDTQVAIYKDILISQDRKKFTHLVCIIAPLPHPSDKPIFFEQLFKTAIECDDIFAQDAIFKNYSIEDAGKFIDKLNKEYNNIIKPKSGLILPS